MVKKKFDVVIERDEDGWLIADVPELNGCHTQGKNMDELIKNVKEVIELCLEVQKENKNKEQNSFIGIRNFDKNN